MDMEYGNTQWKVCFVVSAKGCLQLFFRIVIIPSCSHSSCDGLSFL